MARGRRGDTPALQQAKGNPGRRKGAVAARIAEAERVAQLLAAAPSDGDDVLAPPAMLNDPLAAAALKVWQDYAPELRRTQRLGKIHRLSFAMFCVYMGEWIAACEDIRQNGYSQKVKAVAGGVMERMRPVVAWREMAYKNATDLGGLFGLTPREEYSLFRDQADAVSKNPGLFDQRPQQAKPAAGEETPAAPAAPSGSLIGSLADLDSPPPGSSPH